MLHIYIYKYTCSYYTLMHYNLNTYLQKLLFNIFALLKLIELGREKRTRSTRLCTNN